MCLAGWLPAESRMIAMLSRLGVCLAYRLLFFQHCLFDSIGPITRADINEYCHACDKCQIYNHGPVPGQRHTVDLNHTSDKFTKFVEDTATKSLNPSDLIISALFLHNEWICRTPNREAKGQLEAIGVSESEDQERAICKHGGSPSSHTTRNVYEHRP
jgi:hypothetical protein